MSTFLQVLIVVSFNIVVIWSAVYESGLISPFTLHRGDRIESSSNSEVNLQFQQNDGNLVFRKTATAVWSTNDEGVRYGSNVTLQEDGDFVMFDNHSEAIWRSSSLHGSAPFMLMVSESDGVAMLYILDSTNNIVWSRSSDTSTAPASYPTLPPHVLFPIDQRVTIWNDDMQTNDGWITNNANTGGIVVLPTNSAGDIELCGQCARLVGGDGKASIEKQTDISEYKSIRFTVDIMHWGSESSQDHSLLEYKYDNDEWIEYGRYGMENNKKWTYVVINFDIPASTQSLAIRISVETVIVQGTLNKCYVDNAILIGLPLDPTTQPTRNPTETTSTPTTIPSVLTHDPTNFPTMPPTRTPTVPPTAYTEDPTSTPTANPSATPTYTPTPAPLNPSTAPTNVPTNDPTEVREGERFDETESTLDRDSSPSSTHKRNTDSWVYITVIGIIWSVVCCLCCCIYVHMKANKNATQHESAINNDIQHEDLQSDPVTKQGPPAGVMARATSGEMGGRLPIYNAQLVMKGSVKVTRGNVAMQKVVKHENEGEMGHTQQTPKDDIIDFDRDLVVQWMRNKVKLPQYTENFLNQGYVMMSAIQAINSREELAVCGVQKEGHQTLILAEIALYKVQNVTPGVNNKSNEDNAVGGQLPPPPMTGDTNGGNEGWLDIT
eukprot:81523_1